MVAWVKFISEIAEKITERGLDGRIVRSLDEDDEMGVGIVNPLTNVIEGTVEMESGMAGGEAGHKDVEIGRIRFALLVHLVMDLDPLFGNGADPSHVVGAAVQELPEVGRIEKFFDLCLVGLLPELEDDVFAFVPSSDVFMLKVSCGAVAGIPTGFFLEFEPCVDVLGKESDLRFGKMVDLMNVEQPVAFLEGHGKFRGAPCAGEGTLGIRVMTVIDVLVE